MVNTFFNTTEDMIINLQKIKGKVKLNFYKIISIYYEKMNIRRPSVNFQFEENPFNKNVVGIGKIYHEVLLLMGFLQTKPSVN